MLETAAPEHQPALAEDRPRRVAIGDILTHPVLPLSVFGIVTITLWVVGNGIPYGYDSIETYFTYLVAYNAATFAAVNPLMQDQVASPNPAAHPYYYTHHPNLIADLLSQGLIRAGAADLRIHDLAAVAISVFGAYLAFISVRRMGGPVLATVVTLIFAVHYVGILTWTSDILRALHLPLFWGTIYLVQRYVETPTRGWLLAVASAVFVVFLNDYTLALFIWCIAMLLVVQAALPGKLKLAFTGGCTLAAAVAIVVWASIEVAVLGVDTVVQDAMYTYLRRNAAGMIGDLQTMTEFYRSHYILFWGHLDPTDDRLGLIETAFRTTFQLGHGALVLVVYPLIACEALYLLFRRLGHGTGRTFARLDIATLVLTGGVIVLVLLAQGGKGGLLDDWEIIPQVPLARLLLVAALIGIVVCCWRTLRSPGATAVTGAPVAGPGLLDRWVNPRGRSRAVTVGSFVVAVGVTSFVLSWFWTGGFAATFIWGYKPSIVFAEDLVVATLLIVLCQFAMRWRQHLLPSIGAAILVAMGGGYWLAYQAKLMVRYPPLELTIANQLRNNPAVQGKSFVSPETYQIVWYYTHGEGHGIEATPDGNAIDVDKLMFFRDWATNTDHYRHPQFFICARQNMNPASSNPCDSWRHLLTSLGFPADEGGNFVSTPDYLIYSSSAVPLLNLQPVPTVDSVRAVVQRLEDGRVNVAATFAARPIDDATVSPIAPLIRLYRVDGAGCLVGSTDAPSGFQLPRDTNGQFRVSVTPRTAYVSGNEVFSDPVTIELARFTLPDIQTGGVQQIPAATLEEAEQIALAAGTWNPKAGTLGAGSDSAPQYSDPGRIGNTPLPSREWANTACPAQ
ncbi:MAG: hypothetical protein JO352_39365 [Chloroflexi bacterium]|nr:hypothetical protein [Chloroflexota bacterium]